MIHLQGFFQGSKGNLPTANHNFIDRHVGYCYCYSNQQMYFFGLAAYRTVVVLHFKSEEFLAVMFGYFRHVNPKRLRSGGGFFKGFPKSVRRINLESPTIFQQKCTRWDPYISLFSWVFLHPINWPNATQGNWGEFSALKMEF